jgi:hypothetical protein
MGRVIDEEAPLEWRAPSNEMNQFYRAATSVIAAEQLLPLRL